MSSHYINNRRIFLMKELLKDIKKYRIEIDELPKTEILKTKEYNTVLNLLPTQKIKERCFERNSSTHGGLRNYYLIYNDTIIGIYVSISKKDDYFYIRMSLGYDNEVIEIYDNNIEFEYYRCDQLIELKNFFIKVRDWYLSELKN